MVFLQNIKNIYRIEMWENYTKPTELASTQLGDII